MTAETAGARKPIEKRLAALADELRSLAHELGTGQQQDEPEPAPPPQGRTTAGADALRYMDEHHPVATAAGDIEQEEHR